MTTVIGRWKAWQRRALGVIWQENFFDHRIRNKSEHQLKADYIRHNPVVKGWCTKPADWPWVLDAASLDQSRWSSISTSTTGVGAETDAHLFFCTAPNARLLKSMASTCRLLILLAASVFLAGCSRDTAPVAPVAKPKILHLGNNAEPEDLDPQAIDGIPEHKIVMALFEGLVTEDPKDLHPIPGQAESWEISADGLTYTFHLRAGLKWSDGVQLTAGNFIESYERILTPEFASEYSYLLWFVKGAEEYNKGALKDFSQVGFRAPDDRTLVVTLKEPVPFLLNIIASHYTWMPVPLRVIAQHGPVHERRTPWTRAGTLVSNGPFLLKEWSPNQQVVVARNPHYWDAANVKLDEVVSTPSTTRRPRSACSAPGSSTRPRRCR